MEKKYIGNINSQIQTEKTDLRGYEKNFEGTSAYVSEPVFDENWKLLGKKSFIYVQKVKGKAQEILGTYINVIHLIHELGHAWNAEKEEYRMVDEGILIKRVGTATFRYSFIEGENGQKIKKTESVEGIFLEEELNTLEEEKSVANYFGVSLEGVGNIYREPIGRSAYQGLGKDATKELVKIASSEDFKNWRLYGDEAGKDNIENHIKQTESWNERSATFSRILDNKRKIFEEIKSPKVEEFFKKHEEVYFPSTIPVTPIQQIDNILEQFFHLQGFIALNMGKNYSEFVKQVIGEITPMIKQAQILNAKENLKKVIENVKMTDVQKITSQTKQILKEGKVLEGEKDAKD